jgi:hypothetical protein
VHSDGQWSSPVGIDPFEIAIEDKVSLLFAANQAALDVRGARFVNASFSFLREDKFFANSEGTVTNQTIYRTTPNVSVTAVAEDGSDFQSRAVLLDVAVEEPHQAANLRRGAVPVLGGEREERQVGDAEIGAALDDLADPVRPAPMAVQSWQAAALGPSAVPVHDDRDMAGALALGQPLDCVHVLSNLVNACADEPLRSA